MIMMARNLTLFDIITLIMTGGAEFWDAFRRVSTTPLVQVPPGWGARSKGRVGVGMVVGAVPAIAPRARTSTGSAASKHDQHPGFAGWSGR